MSAARDSGLNPAGFAGDESRGQPREETEVSLVDLWLLLTRRRLIFGATLAVCLITGLAVVVLKEPRYAFRTTIQVGSFDASPLEAPKTVAAKLEEAYVPKVMAGLPEGAQPRISIQLPEGSDLVVIRSEGPANEAERHFSLHREVLALLLADHDDLVRSQRAPLQGALTAARARYESLLTQHRALVRDLDSLAPLGAAESDPGVGTVPDAVSGPQEGLTGVEMEAQPLLSLMIRNQAQQNRMVLWELAERLQEKIALLESRLGAIRATRPVVGQARSLEPISPEPAAVLSIALVLGLIVGVFSVLIVELLTKAGGVRDAGVARNSA